MIPFPFLAELAGVKVPEGTKILIGETVSTELSEEFAHEKLSPVLAMYKAEDILERFSEAIGDYDRMIEEYEAEEAA